ncbi:hypothetical protein [Photobacterium sp. 1_MG-2023]|uniref:hypothetical protein n=1 Tax=Photobacterium sp. 1_MG-2023 TaxID=3062646 RepID=UPI0026E2523B|nr:hypothetical protein [Photobacterium sp. 1_MG-2023]MDO6708359.1 hypothetical protein [Photobacterium sp. 1_MG-2023]
MTYIDNPKFIHNLWTHFEDNPDVYLLRTSKGYFEVDKNDSELFLKFRGLCTGHNSQSEISDKTGIPLDKISDIIKSLEEIECLRIESDINLITDDIIYDKMKTACEMWAEQLEDSHLFNDVIHGNHDINILKGLLLETYHYIKDFPDCIKAARDNTSNNRLKEKLDIYYNQEKGHEVFILSCLEKLGLSSEEVTTSIPLVSTQSLLNLIKDLFVKYPYSVALVARVIEADEYNEDIAIEIRNALENNLKIDRNCLDGLIEHMAIDYSLGHSNLIDEHHEFIKVSNIEDAHIILNRIHDIKHSFDIQKLEILDYYGHTGNYIPRQRVDFFGV